MPRKKVRPAADAEFSLKKNAKDRYSEADKGKALALLAANNGNYRDTASALGMPPSTLEYWAKYREGTSETYAMYQAMVPQLVALKTIDAIVENRVKLVPKLLEACLMLSDVLTDKKKIKDLAIRDAAVGLGIAIDKLDKLCGIGLKAGGANVHQQNTLNVTQTNIELAPEDRERLEQLVGDAYVSLPVEEGGEIVDAELVEEGEVIGDSD